MLFNPGRAKQVQDGIFLKQINKIIDPSLYFNDSAMKLMHIQKTLGHQLDNKMSFNEYTNNKISKSKEKMGLLGKLQRTTQELIDHL